MVGPFSNFFCQYNLGRVLWIYTLGRDMWSPFYTFGCDTTPSMPVTNLWVGLVRDLWSPKHLSCHPGDTTLCWMFIYPPEKEIGGDLTHHLFSAPFDKTGMNLFSSHPLIWRDVNLAIPGAAWWAHFEPQKGMHKMTVEGFWMIFGCHFKMKKGKHRMHDIMQYFMIEMYVSWICMFQICFETTRIQFCKSLSLKNSTGIPKPDVLF